MNSLLLKIAIAILRHQLVGISYWLGIDSGIVIRIYIYNNNDNNNIYLFNVKYEQIAIKNKKLLQS